MRRRFRKWNNTIFLQFSQYLKYTGEAEPLRYCFDILVCGIFWLRNIYEGLIMKEQRILSLLMILMLIFSFVKTASV